MNTPIRSGAPRTSGSFPWYSKCTGTSDTSLHISGTFSLAAGFWTESRKTTDLIKGSKMPAMRQTTSYETEGKKWDIYYTQVYGLLEKQSTYHE